MSRTAAASTLVLLLLAPSCAGKPSPYNVLLVTLDTVRADYFSSYGYPRPSTPHFDRLGMDGVRFELAIAQAAVTPVSHASILTGRNPYSHGVRVLHAAAGYRLPEDVPYLPEQLRRRGWRTGAFLSAFPVSGRFGFRRGFDHFDSGIDDREDAFTRKGDGHFAWRVDANQRRSDATTDRALAWLAAGESRFFAWVHYWDPHDTALLPPPEHLDRFVSPGLEAPDRRRAVYAAELSYVDRQFGRLMTWLEESGRLDDTVVVVVADHGQGLGDHGWWHHRILYQEQIRVPLLMRWPGEVARPVVEELVRTIDIQPTILDLVAVTPREPGDGRTLRPLVEGRDDELRVAYADQLNLYDTNATVVARRPDDALLHCAMDARWKLVYRPLEPQKSTLFDLHADPAETRNLYRRGHPEVLRLRRFVRPGLVDGPFGEDTDPEVIERLRALGYLD